MFEKNPPKTNTRQFSNRTLNKYKQTISLWENRLKYRMEIDNLVEWCHNNNFTLIISKAKEMIVDWGQTKDNAPVIISRMMGRESPISWVNTSLMICPGCSILMQSWRKFNNPTFSEVWGDSACYSISIFYVSMNFHNHRWRAYWLVAWPEIWMLKNEGGCKKWLTLKGLNLSPLKGSMKRASSSRQLILS